MRFAAAPPSRWVVELHSGEIIELAADGYSRTDGDLLFSILVDATVAEQADVRVIGRTPTDPERVIILVARIPERAVAEIHGGEPWPAVQQPSAAADLAEPDRRRLGYSV
ncbi:hypothetical protein [Asanoa iriomotensis]|uniref:Uncharacterized protein n=1 Tax=Asanoa iriomotensis TaxID=234613 RepID=A0ABQ4CDK1_9ACTN|nr:hypothetical protein [Asanoa iriomotensis]GIF60536.1 hypothetical protein Air01nite_66310 [Asanoa iriomotensis]